MKKFIPFFLCMFLQVVLSESQNKYTSMYDNIDLNEVVRNERLLKNYVHCLLDEGRCTPDGAELRKNLPDAIINDCNKCTEKQKEGADFMMQFLIDNKPEYWNRLQVKYDPSGSYRTKYLEAKGKAVAREESEEE
ncbi:ejaculatory bulb-specific protein 3-like [Coccinella septempunctata]|uniref:ejaculatory bulb-specific protein 3-like n=1 Tax=Coccinella septempunctata TaxID=41139 RepID=UPI001D093260|nr:ejaculatory bulb-specific protein 3-like [Coccinella septempunctata]